MRLKEKKFRSKSTQADTRAELRDVGCSTATEQDPLEVVGSSPSKAGQRASGSEGADADGSSDYAPSEGAVSDEDLVWEAEQLECVRRLIDGNPMRYLGISEKNSYVVDLICANMSYHQRGQLLTKKDVVHALLMWIRTGMPAAIVADMFGMHKGSMSRLMSRYLPMVAECLRCLVYWPPSENIQNRVPMAFKAYYHDVESIIDCFEIQVQKSKSALAQSLSWSDYKKCNTVKYFVSCTPDGLINFVSRGKPGRCSDMEILRSSGYLECVRPNTTVLADRGFKELERDLFSRGSRLVRPPSVRKEQQLDSSEVKKMKAIAGLRIHVERVIGRLRLYRAVDIHATVPLSLMGCLDDVVMIVCDLANLQDPIVNV